MQRFKMARPKKENQDEVKRHIVSIRLSTIEHDALLLLAGKESIANYIKSLALKKIKKK